MSTATMSIPWQSRGRLAADAHNRLIQQFPPPAIGGCRQPAATRLTQPKRQDPMALCGHLRYMSDELTRRLCLDCVEQQPLARDRAPYR